MPTDARAAVRLESVKVVPRISAVFPPLEGRVYFLVPRALCLHSLLADSELFRSFARCLPAAGKISSSLDVDENGDAGRTSRRQLPRYAARDEGPTGSFSVSDSFDLLPYLKARIPPSLDGMSGMLLLVFRGDRFCQIVTLTASSASADRGLRRIRFPYRALHALGGKPRRFLSPAVF